MDGNIDRMALVRRNSPSSNSFDPHAAFTVGNGEFAFTADATGLQTFPDLYAERFPLCTASHWGWHTIPAPEAIRGATIRATNYDAHGRPVPYVTDKTGQEALFDWLRQNPHRLHLGRIGLDLRHADGAPALPTDIGQIDQRLDLWAGILYSDFVFDGETVSVLTCCHGERDLLAVRVRSPLVDSGRLGVCIAFPYGSPVMGMADWESAHRHQTIVEQGASEAHITRQLDGDRYHAHLAWSEGAELNTVNGDPHRFRLTGAGQGSTLEVVCHFSPAAGAGPLPPVSECVAASESHWETFWSEGGAVDFSDCTDPRASELERRVVLSQYVTALHSGGSLPPAETGLLCNSWYGKFHLEMHWWHAVHFAVWNRFSRLEASLGYCQRIRDRARVAAAVQGYRGARWPKMADPEGRDSPSPVGPLLIWQQPHPIYYAELAYRQSPNAETIARWQDVVFDTAEFMASYAAWDAATERYVLGPPLKSVSENTEARATTNPTFELTYWRFGLRVAQEWRKRAGLAPNPEWNAVRERLAPAPQNDGAYLLQEGMTDTYTTWNWEHPAMLGALGVLPGDGIDAETMRETVKRALSCWRWEKKTWGWDLPMAAMAAARAGEPDLAVDVLLIDIPQNTYVTNGHVPQRADLPAYLPANGGLLAAVALMAAGWESGGGSAPGPNPGFPRNGRWSVRSEGLRPML
ncbi:MAG: glycoside hydrolase family 65 [Armatimonadota bacterium]